MATGSAAAMPPIDGLEEVEPWNNRDITTAKQVPESLLILGGGPVGSEMAQAWNSLGSGVVLVEASEHLLARESPSPVSSLPRRCGSAASTCGCRPRPPRRGASRETSCSSWRTASRSAAPSSWSRSAASPAPKGSAWRASTCSPANADFLRSMTSCASAAATGCTPSGTSTAAPAHPHGEVPGPVGRRSHPRQGGCRDRGAPRLAPRHFHRPPGGRGRTDSRRRPRRPGVDARAVDVDINGPAGASFFGKDQPGTARLVVDEDRKVVVGATFAGFEVAEFLHAATIAVVGEVPLEKLWHAVPSFPSRSEIWLNLLEEYGALTDGVRANVTATTRRAPEARSTRAHAVSVAPVVCTSSMSNARRAPGRWAAHAAAGRSEPHGCAPPDGRRRCEPGSAEAAARSTRRAVGRSPPLDQSPGAAA